MATKKKAEAPTMDLGKEASKALAILASYGRSFMAAALALYMTGNTNPKDLAMAGVAAVAPVLLRALNKNEKAFGLTK